MSSLSKRKRGPSTPSTRPLRSTQQESQELLSSHASENSPDIENDEDYEEDEDHANLEEEEPLVCEAIPKPKKSKIIPKRSVHWAHFRSFEDDDGNSKAECNYRKTVYAVDSYKNGVSNLGKHRKSCVENPENKNKEKGMEYATMLNGSAKRIFEQYRVLYAPPPPSSAIGSIMTGLTSAAGHGTRIGGGDLNDFVNLKDSEVCQMGESSGPNYASEFDRYFHELICREHDALTWWKLNGHRFPILAKMARDVLAMPVTTVPSESAFSTGGRTISQFRSSLSPKMVEAFICTQDWILAAVKAREMNEVEAQTVLKDLKAYHESEKIVEDLNEV